MATREIEMGSPEINAIDQAMANTEKEVFAEALDENAEDQPGYQRDPGELPDRSLEQEEGWDGLPYDRAAEGGATEHGFDRPNQLAADEALTGQLAERDALIASQRERMAELEQRADPEFRQRLEKQREDLVIRMLSNPNETLEHIATLQQQVKGMHDNHINASMAAVHRSEGQRFERAYGALTSLDPRNPVARSIAQAITRDPDPGRALMEWYDSAASRLPPSMGGAARRDAMRMPSLNGQSAGSRGAANGGSRRSNGGDEYYTGNNSGADLEAEIFGSAF